MLIRRIENPDDRWWRDEMRVYESENRMTVYNDIVKGGP